MRRLCFVLWISAVFSVIIANPLSHRSNNTTTNTNSNINPNSNPNSNSNSLRKAQKDEPTPPLYRCVCNDLGEFCHNHTCTTTGSCFAFLKGGHVIRTCAFSEQSGLMYCKSKIQGVQDFKCCRGDFCNKKLDFAPLLTETTSEKEGFDRTNLFVILLVVVVLVCVAFGGGLIYCRRRRAKESKLNAQQKSLLEEEISSQLPHDHVSSGSGSGQPALVQRTAGKDCCLIEQIGQGRFGEVWKGIFKGDVVAVKIFTSLVENSWKQERDIYNMGLLRHDNILGFYASDTTARNSCTVHMIIVHYHHHGSLYDYLKLSDIDMEEMMTLALSASSGINYLHNEIRQGTGTNEKPYIAHRDIKSKNILVKSNGECCIGDFGYAITETEGWEKTIDDLRVGTKRYMAPELLAETLNPKHFRAFLCVDIYAFGLILWEIARRARPFSEEYQMPFWNVVPANPSFEDMKDVVVFKQMRPPIPNTWESQPLMVEMEKLIRGCWAQSASSRLSILRVKLNLSNLRGHTDWSSKTEKMLPRFDGSTTKTNDSLALTSSSSPVIT